MTTDSDDNLYAEWFEQVRSEYSEQLKLMPLPAGLPEYLHKLVGASDEEAIQFMLKLAWQLGAQMGYEAGLRKEELARIANIGFEA